MVKRIFPPAIIVMTLILLMLTIWIPDFTHAPQRRRRALITEGAQKR